MLRSIAERHGADAAAGYAAEKAERDETFRQHAIPQHPEQAPALAAVLSNDSFPGYVWMVGFDDDAYFLEDPETGRAWAWRCVLMDRYPTLASTSLAEYFGTWTPWPHVEPLLSDLERAAVSDAYLRQATPWRRPLVLDWRPRPRRYHARLTGGPVTVLPANCRVALLTWETSREDPSGRRISATNHGLGTVHGDPPERFYVLEAKDGGRPGGVFVERELGPEQEPKIIAAYNGPWDIIRAMARAPELAGGRGDPRVDELRREVVEDTRLPRELRDELLESLEFLELLLPVPSRARIVEAAFWDARVQKLEDVWALWYSATSPRVPYSEAASLFDRVASGIVPRVDRHSREIQPLANEAAVYDELCQLVRRIAQDAAARDAADPRERSRRDCRAIRAGAIREKYAPVLPWGPPGVATEAAKIFEPRRGQAACARQMFRHWAGISDRLAKERVAAWRHT